MMLYLLSKLTVVCVDSIHDLPDMQVVLRLYRSCQDMTGSGTQKDLKTANENRVYICIIHFQVY